MLSLLVVLLRAGDFYYSSHADDEFKMKCDGSHGSKEGGIGVQKRARIAMLAPPAIYAT